jgi:hypothetical protein
MSWTVKWLEVVPEIDTRKFRAQGRESRGTTEFLKHYKWKIYPLKELEKLNLLDR